MAQRDGVRRRPVALEHEPQTLLRQFVADRVYEEEKREGVLK